MPSGDLLYYFGSQTVVKVMLITFFSGKTRRLSNHSVLYTVFFLTVLGKCKYFWVFTTCILNSDSNLNESFYA